MTNNSDIWQEPKEKNKIFTSPISKNWQGEDGIGRVVFLANTKITLKAAKEHITGCTKLAQRRKRPILVDLRNLKSADYQGRKYLGSSEESTKITKAAALIIGSPLSKLLGNFFIGLNRPPYPTRLFTSEKKAIDWLKKFLK